MKHLLETLLLWSVALLVLATAWTIGSAKVESFHNSRPQVTVLTGS